MRSITPFTRVLRDAAPKLSRRFFECQRCHASTAARTSVQSQVRALNRSVFRAQRLQSTLTFPGAAEVVQTKPRVKLSYPDSSSNGVAYWLLGSAASVFGIVVFGGWTRLTESGYERAICPSSTLTNLTIQPKHNRMEARHRLPPTTLRSRMGL